MNINREIKFRVWNRYKKVMQDWEHIGLEMTMVPLCSTHGDNPVHFHLDEVFKLIEAEGILVQYTGLKDKNGKEIYEGDIIKVGETENDTDATTHEVKWFGDEGYPAFDLKDWDGEANALSEYAQGTVWIIEIIGNIYENPELLK